MRCLSGWLIVISVLLGAAITIETWADVPETMSYQGRLTDNSGQNVPDGNYNVRFTVYDAPSIGVILWAETLAVDVSSGLFTVQLGQEQPLSAALFSTSDRWLGIAIGADPELTPRTKFTTSAYAFIADDSGAYLPLAGGTMTGPITSIGDPSITMGKGNFGGGNINSGNQASVAGMNNRAWGDFSVVAGGGGPVPEDSNVASGLQSAIGGGMRNYARGLGGFVGGGVQNLVREDFSAVCGGAGNLAYSLSFVGGGGNNSAIASNAVVAGGSGNQSSSDAATIGGGVYNVASGLTSTVSGGKFNHATGNTSSIGGGESCGAAGEHSGVFSGFINTAGTLTSDTAAFVGGGSENYIHAKYGTIAGGQYDTVTWAWATICGGFHNKASGEKSFIGGGGLNTASGWGSTISGGYGNYANNDEGTVAGGLYDTAGGQWSTVSGGYQNVASGRASCISGGQGNRAIGEFSTVGAGLSDSALGIYSFIGGGCINTAIGAYAGISSGYQNAAGATPGDTGAFVGGGYYVRATNKYATAVGGYANEASGLYSTVAGGNLNNALGEASFVAGGTQNTATGERSFAGGRHAIAFHDGSFIWNGDGVNDCYSDRNFQVKLRALGGVRLILNSSGSQFVEFYDNAMGKFINTSTTAYLSTGGAWVNASDENLKENFNQIDGFDLLLKIGRLPITRWNYKAEDQTITHIGPTAQDFNALFDVGDDITSISTIDPAGVALAGVQELIKQIAELRQENAEIRAELKKLQGKIQ